MLDDVWLVAGTHTDYKRLQDEPAKVVKEHKILGCQYVQLAYATGI